MECEWRLGMVEWEWESEPVGGGHGSGLELRKAAEAVTAELLLQEGTFGAKNALSEERTVVVTASFTTSIWGFEPNMSGEKTTCWTA